MAHAKVKALCIQGHCWLCNALLFEASNSSSMAAAVLLYSVVISVAFVYIVFILDVTRQQMKQRHNVLFLFVRTWQCRIQGTGPIFFISMLSSAKKKPNNGLADSLCRLSPSPGNCGSTSAAMLIPHSLYAPRHLLNIHLLAIRIIRLMLTVSVMFNRFAVSLPLSINDLLSFTVNTYIYNDNNRESNNVSIRKAM